MGVEVERQYTRWSVNSFNMHHAAHYRLGMAGPQYRSKAVNILKNDLQWTFAAHAKKNVFRETLDVMQWGSSTEMCGRALVAFYYEELTKDDSYHKLAM